MYYLTSSRFYGPILTSSQVIDCARGSEVHYDAHLDHHRSSQLDGATATSTLSLPKYVLLSTTGILGDYQNYFYSRFTNDKLE